MNSAIHILLVTLLAVGLSACKATEDTVSFSAKPIGGGSDTSGVASEFLSCTVSQNGDVTTVSCPDGSSANIYNGTDGNNGSSCSVHELEIGAMVVCDDETTAVLQHGQDGEDGQDGNDGQDGVAGSSCSVANMENGDIVISCEDGSMALVEVTPEGQYNEWAIVDVINPCDDVNLDEVIIRFANGQLMAHYSHNNRQHFTLVTPGNYVTTDNTACHFTVTNDLQVVW